MRNAPNSLDQRNAYVLHTVPADLENSSSDELPYTSTPVPFIGLNSGPV